MSYNKLTDAEEEILVLLIEESSEVIKAATKILRHGTDPPIYDNLNNLEREIGHVRFVVDELIDRKKIIKENIDSFKREKSREIGRYLHHADTHLYKKGE